MANETLIGLKENWIDAREQQPNECENVLIWNAIDREVQIAWFSAKTEQWFGVAGEDLPALQLVSHWMPLPSQPNAMRASISV